MRGGGIRTDAQVGIFHRTQLPLQQKLLARCQRLMDKGKGIPYIGGQDIAITHQGVEECPGLQRISVVEVDKQDIFEGADGLQTLH